MNQALEAAQLIFPGYAFGIDDAAQAEALAELGVGGFCLYGGEVREVAEFVERLQKKAPRPLLFCADYEDGVASQSAGGTWLPTNLGVGCSGSAELAFRKAVITAREAKALGVHWILAPVVDLVTRRENPIVNVRSFSERPEVVVEMARAYLKGLRSENVLSCLKHFPGHGETTVDSHLELPRVDCSAATLEARELKPYKELCAEADSVMTGHLLVAALEPDPATPVSLSRAAVAGALRGRLGFRGLVSTDALTMHAIAKNTPELTAAVMALKGGSDVLLVPAESRKLVFGLLELAADDKDLQAAMEAAGARVRAAKEKVGLSAQGGPPKTEFAIVNSAEHRREAAVMAEACLAWQREPAVLSGSVTYWEPDADSQEELQGNIFVEMMRQAGLKVELGEPKAAGNTVVIGCFLRPHAYSGRIAYEPELIARSRRVMEGAQRAVVVSFGSPFVIGQFEGAESGLCAFSSDEHAQRAAARALAGQVPAKGRLSVGALSKGGV